MHILLQVQLTNRLNHQKLPPLLRNPLDPRKVLNILHHRQILDNQMLLRTVTNKLSDEVEVLLQLHSLHLYSSLSGGFFACKHFEDG